MPNYASGQSGYNPATPTVTSGQGAAGQPGGFNLTSLTPGDFLYLFNAETITAPQASIAFARGSGPVGDDAGTTFHIDFASAPTSSVVIQCSNLDIDADYQTIYTSTNTQHDSYTDIGRSTFYRAKVASQSAGGAITVTVQR